MFKKWLTRYEDPIFFLKCSSDKIQMTYFQCQGSTMLSHYFPHLHSQCYLGIFPHWHLLFPPEICKILWKKITEIIPSLINQKVPLKYIALLYFFGIVISCLYFPLFPLTNVEQVFLVTTHMAKVLTVIRFGGEKYFSFVALNNFQLLFIITKQYCFSD